MYVVVQFYPWFKFYFLLFQTHYHVIIIHYHTQKQTTIEFEPRIKLNHNVHVFYGEKIGYIGISLPPTNNPQTRPDWWTVLKPSFVHVFFTQYIKRFGHDTNYSNCMHSW